jgi:hypothetical protein
MGSVPSNDNDYPLLSCALGQEDGFNPSDPTIQKDMQALLADLIYLLSTDYELNVIDSRNNTYRPPFESLKLPAIDHSKTPKNGMTLPSIAGSKHGGTDESAYRIANRRFYKDSVLVACETQKVLVCKPMSATAFSSMMCAARISGTGEQEMKKHLCTHLGPGFCPTKKNVSMLSEGRGVVHYDSIDFTLEGKTLTEFIEWTEKSIDDKIAWYLQRHLMSKNVNPSDGLSVQVVVGGNHGETAFQFGASVSVKLCDGNIIEFEVSVCELICRKDTAK